MAVCGTSGRSLPADRCLAFGGARLLSIARSSCRARTRADLRAIISDVDGSNEVFVVTDDTKTTRDGKEANLSDLSEGDAVTVIASRRKGKLTAKTITARTGKGTVPWAKWQVG